MIPRLTHRAVIAAPPESVYRLVADVTRWPLLFTPILCARYLHRAPTNERFELWTGGGDDVRRRVSRRVLQVAERRILFRREDCPPPVAGVSGTWSFRALTGGRTEVVREHALELDGDAEARTLATEQVAGDTIRELAELTRIAELGPSIDRLLHTVSEVVELDRPAAEVYRRVLDSAITPDSAACWANERISYKSPAPPVPVAAHCGEWGFTPLGERTRATARHTVIIHPAEIRTALGDAATLDDAREHLRAEFTATTRAALNTAVAARAGHV